MNLLIWRIKWFELGTSQTLWLTRLENSHLRFWMLKSSSISNLNRDITALLCIVTLCCIAALLHCCIAALLHCCIAALLHCCIWWRLESFADYQSIESFLANKYISKVVFQQVLTIFASRTWSPIELADPFLLHARWVQLISTVHWPSNGPQSTKDSNWEQLVEKPERYLCAASPPQKKKCFELHSGNLFGRQYWLLAS